MFYKSLEVGDIPYSDALESEEGVQKLKYDTERGDAPGIGRFGRGLHYSSSGDEFDGDLSLAVTLKLEKTVVAFELKVLTTCVSRKRRTQT